MSRSLPSFSATVMLLIGDANEGLFAPATAFSRQRVHKVFHDAVVGATDAPRPEVAAALGRLLVRRLNRRGVVNAKVIR